MAKIGTAFLELRNFVAYFGLSFVLRAFGYHFDWKEFVFDFSCFCNIEKICKLFPVF